jgi:mRNA-degrading endonuclease toxin of MazEF toxin-antitoxin module
MINAGDIHLADLNEEKRRRVLVLSNSRFEKATARVLVAPEIETQPDDVLFPWQIRVGPATYAVDLMRSMPTSRLLRRVDRATPAAMSAVRRVLSNIV